MKIGSLNCKHNYMFGNNDYNMSVHIQNSLILHSNTYSFLHSYRHSSRSNGYHMLQRN